MACLLLFQSSIWPQVKPIVCCLHRLCYCFVCFSRREEEDLWLTFLMTAPLFSKRIVFQQTPSKEEENEDLFGRRHRILICLSNLLFSVSGQKINCIKRWRLKIWLFVTRCYFLKQTLFVTWCYFSFDVNALCTFDVRKALLVAPLLFVLLSRCLCVVILSSSSVYLSCYHQHFC